MIAAGQLGIFANGYWGHPAMKLPPEVNLLAVAHYLQALEYQRKANQVVAILGSKTPNIQNLAVGGVANAINLDNEATLNMEKLYFIKDLLDEVKTFVEQVYSAGRLRHRRDVPRVARLRRRGDELPGGARPAARRQGHRVRPARAARSWTATSVALPADRPLRRPALRRTTSTESIAHAWYDGDWQKHPWTRRRSPKYTDFQDDGKYSWVKAPRFEGKPMQVGPLAQVLVGYAAGHELITKYVDDVGGPRLVESPRSRSRSTALHSTLGRHRRPRHPLRRARRARPQALGAAGRQHRQGRH